ncbi:MAG: hypothetical protein S0880_00350 [Actinomycetota bacterium]|nr:hypothetical protein [Actinomycetota bacterium]
MDRRNRLALTAAMAMAALTLGSACGGTVADGAADVDGDTLATPTGALGTATSTVAATEATPSTGTIAIPPGHEGLDAWCERPGGARTPDTTAAQTSVPETTVPRPTAGPVDGSWVTAVVAGFDLRPALVERDGAVALELDVPDDAERPGGAASVAAYLGEPDQGGILLGRVEVGTTPRWSLPLDRDGPGGRFGEPAEWPFVLGLEGADGALVDSVRPCLAPAERPQDVLVAEAQSIVVDATSAALELGDAVVTGDDDAEEAALGDYVGLLDQLAETTEAIRRSSTVDELWGALPLTASTPLTAHGVGPIRLDGVTLGRIEESSDLGLEDDFATWDPAVTGCFSAWSPDQPDLTVEVVGHFRFGGGDPPTTMTVPPVFRAADGRVDGFVLRGADSVRTTAEGIGIGATVAEVRAVYPDVTAPSGNAEGDGTVLVRPWTGERPGIAFVTDGDVVEEIRYGQPSVVDQINGCGA